MCGVVVGTIGVATIVVSIAWVERWRRWWVLVFAVVASFASCAATVSPDDVGFFVIECVATLFVAAFFPLRDAMGHSVVIVLPKRAARRRGESKISVYITESR